MGLENSVELLDQLRCELLLRQVVGALHDYGNQSIIGHLAILTRLLRFPAYLVERFGAK